jgi:hypothetical protein
MNTEIINSKTVAGLVEFCDYLSAKGLATGKAMENWKGAAKNVFSAVEGDDYAQTSLDGLDLDEFLDRFEVLTRGKYKPESLTAYGSRVRAAVEAYLAFVADGTTPKLARRSPSASGAAKPAVTPRSSSPKRQQRQQETEGELVEFPFPLQSGEMASLRLPKRLHKDDADRLRLFLTSLQSEPQAQIPQHTGEEMAA